MSDHCGATLADGPLVCVRPAHEDRGHVYHASSPGDPEASYDE